MTRPARRPGGVTLLVVLIIIGGALELIGGIFLAVTHNNARVLRNTDKSSQFLLSVGIVAIVIGLIYLLVSRGLAHGNGFARFLVGLISLISLVGGVWAILTQHGNLRSQGISSAVVGAVILLLLYSPKANAFFRTN
jgi:cytochrome bd-type quinol oxidase subunit 2